MADREVSSLDRFMMRHAPVMSGMSGEAVRNRVLAGLGGVYTGAGLGLLLASLVTGGNGNVAVLVPGLVFFGTGGAMLTIRRVLRGFSGESLEAPVPLTREARELVRSLVGHLAGWPFRVPRRRLRRIRKASSHRLRALMGGRRCEDLLSPAAYSVLEAAAFQYNRILGLLTADAPGAPALQKWRPSIVAAAKETTAEILHAAAVMEQVPETAGRFEEEARAQIRQLEQLAETLEQLGTAAAQASLESDSRPRIESLLGELRADQACREEVRLLSEPAEVPAEPLRVGRGPGG